MDAPQRDPHPCVAEDEAEPWDGGYFVSAYPPFRSWRADEIDQVERVLADPRPADAPLGLYVHVPFCVRRCQYCYYLSSVDHSQERIDAYLDAVVRELSRYAQAPYVAGRRPRFVYFGGGTPSLLAADRIDAFLRRLKATLPWDDVEEVTYECAPQSTTDAKLAALRAHDVTRISLGVQALDDRVLALNGRVHCTGDVERAYAAIRRAEFDVVNLDLMVGLVGETDESFDDGLTRVLAMQPDSVTIYQLEIPANTPLHRAIREGLVPTPPATWMQKRARLAHGFARLEAAGYAVRSAYTLGRDERARRFVYQDAQYRGADLLGLGASSFSFLRDVHFQNLVTIDDYQASVADRRLPLKRARRLSDDERLVREFVLQLKLGRVEPASFEARFGVDVVRRFAAPLAKLEREGWLSVAVDSITLTPDGLVRVDRVLPEFYADEHAARVTPRT